MSQSMVMLRINNRRKTLNCILWKHKTRVKTNGGANDACVDGATAAWFLFQRFPSRPAAHVGVKPIFNKSAMHLMKLLMVPASLSRKKLIKNQDKTFLSLIKTRIPRASVRKWMSSTKHERKYSSTVETLTYPASTATACRWHDWFLNRLGISWWSNRTLWWVFWEFRLKLLKPKIEPDLSQIGTGV